MLRFLCASPEVNGINVTSSWRATTFWWCKLNNNCCCWKWVSDYYFGGAALCYCHRWYVCMGGMDWKKASWFTLENCFRHDFCETVGVKTLMRYGIFIAKRTRAISVKYIWETKLINFYWYASKKVCGVCKAKRKQIYLQGWFKMLLYTQRALKDTNLGRNRSVK